MVGNTIKLEQKSFWQKSAAQLYDEFLSTLQQKESDVERILHLIREVGKYAYGWLYSLPEQKYAQDAWKRRDERIHDVFMTLTGLARQSPNVTGYGRQVAQQALTTLLRDFVPCEIWGSQILPSTRELTDLSKKRFQEVLQLLADIKLTDVHEEPSPATRRVREKGTDLANKWLDSLVHVYLMWPVEDWWITPVFYRALVRQGRTERIYSYGLTGCLDPILAWLRRMNHKDLDDAAIRGDIDARRLASLGLYLERVNKFLQKVKTEIDQVFARDNRIRYRLVPAIGADKGEERRINLIINVPAEYRKSPWNYVTFSTEKLGLDPIIGRLDGRGFKLIVHHEHVGD